MNENESFEALKRFSESACFICFWGQNNKCRYMRPEYGTIGMPEDCPDFEHFPDPEDE